ncbi:hypothetical protein P8625_00350 [Tenacibaculum tangerinum]|uniref:DUF2207 domain-containing protein n=1 Tax=Tenacibaculum tangerinum TaxID=3038772 RepID=A0ABY8L4V7_9FLAO|nr:hypothetical protein [Tenacibaculum tangerinum]WGH75647.1 hypothetical protein P8625_00350 [Tenacibaculum tangerinum]
MGINKILEKYKLSKTFETELNVEKEVFINEIKQMTQKGYYTPFLIMLDIVKSENKKYIGDINSKNFKIRERFTLDNSLINNFATVKSEFHTKDDILKVKTTIQGMEMLPFILRVILFGIYLLMMLLLVIEILIPPIQTDIDIAYILPSVFVTIFVGFLTYFPYRIAKKNVVNKKNDIEILYQLIEKTPYNNV